MEFTDAMVKAHNEDDSANIITQEESKQEQGGNDQEDFKVRLLSNSLF